MSDAGIVATNDSTERRHGTGQKLANNTFREFLSDMIAKYGDVAQEGMENFVKNPDHAEVIGLKLNALASANMFGTCVRGCMSHTTYKYDSVML